MPFFDQFNFYAALSVVILLLTLASIGIFSLWTFIRDKIIAESFETLVRYGKFVFSTLAVIGVLATISFGFQGSQQLNSMQTEILKPIEQALEELKVYSRTSIDSFPICKLRAQEMLREVDNNSDAQVDVAVFWPMFGADAGGSFKKLVTGDPAEELEIDFKSEQENIFYYYLFRRVRHNMPVKLLFLDYSEAWPGDEPQSEPQNPSPLHNFIHAISAYRVGDGRLFPDKYVHRILSNVRHHIDRELIPLAGDPKVHLRVTDSLPVLLFIVDTAKGSEESDIQKKGLLFLGNSYMLQHQSSQGGFYTENAAMVDILSGFYDSLYEEGRQLVP